MFERKKPLVSIIIPSWFKPGQDGRWGKNETFWFACECLKKLLERTPKEKYELIIVDNGSTLDYKDSSYIDTDWSQQFTPDWYWSQADILIRNKENLGFAPAINQGVDMASGEYICYINNDILVYPGWLESLLNIYTKTLIPKVGIVMPALVHGLRDPREALKLDTVDCTKNSGIYSPGAEFGSLCLLKKELANQIREVNKKEFGNDWFMNENFRVGFGEDRWLYRQVRMVGYETYRTHDCRVFHGGNYSMSKITNRKDYTVPNRTYLEELKKKYNVN